MVTLLLALTLSQTPVPAQPAPAQPAAPATQKPRPAAPASGATTTALLFITDGSGRAIDGVTVTLTGPVDREAKSSPEGATRIQGLRAGTYRMRFAREGFYTFEKELAWRAGTPAPELSITLNAAPPPPAPPPPPPAPKPVVVEPKLPPPGPPKTLGLPDFIEKNFISAKETQKESLVGCSGVGQGLVWQIRETWDGRQHPSADAMLYVIGGEGTLKLGGNDVNITAGSFAVVPRGTTYGFVRRGKNPLIVLAVLAGAPCAG
jgi:hypothetical protein